ncbi:MAG: Beta-phosphoglucomutase hydrolase [Parcubacteria group bacterium GW2011_GWA2_51_10]|nr:MAG: Beta-phosphoglucomutase hydrolase [Parcubacteria group bacterium GW2011_GWA2_51_10]
MPSILRRIQKCGAVLMLDFDGTLAPIVEDYRRARMPKKTRTSLAFLVKKLPIAVLSGRGLSDIRRKVRLMNVTLVGCHGAEISVPRHGRYVTVAKKRASAFRAVRTALFHVAAEYPKLLIEDKRFAIAAHYRHLCPAKAREFRADARTALASHVKSGTARILDSHSTFDVSIPAHTKGTAANEVYRLLARRNRHAIPIYIGDSTTDEDAFRELKNGVTIRIGPSPSSHAHYYFSSRDEVDTFLSALGEPAINTLSPKW